MEEKKETKSLAYHMGQILASVVSLCGMALIIAITAKLITMIM